MDLVKRAKSVGLVEQLGPGLITGAANDNSSGIGWEATGVMAAAAVAMAFV